jgi:hypothetical protein
MNKQLVVLLFLSLLSLDALAVVDPKVVIDTAKSEIRQIMAILLAALVAIGMVAAYIFMAAGSLRWLRKSA